MSGPRPATEPPPAEERPEPPSGPLFWVGAVVGGAVIGYGVWGLLDQFGTTQAREVAIWFLGGAVLHDGLVAPLAVVLGWALSRALPRLAQRPVQLALAATALLVVFTWPTVRGYGRSAAVPSALPLDYGRNLLWTLVAVWVGAAVWVVVALMREERSG